MEGRLRLSPGDRSRAGWRHNKNVEMFLWSLMMLSWPGAEIEKQAVCTHSDGLRVIIVIKALMRESPCAAPLQ